MSISTTPDLSVVVVSYNTRALLVACLRSLYAQTTSLHMEVIVVDNASSDGSCDAVRSEFPNVHLLANGTNTGFAAGSNQGIRRSTGEYVLLLNPDTVILDRAIERLMAYLEAHGEVGACGPQLRFPDGQYQRNAYPLPSIVGALYELSALFARSETLERALAPDWVDRAEESRSVGYLSGACLLVRRPCLEAVGVLGEGFHMYGEDVDWCTRMWHGGWQVHYVHDAAVVHYLGASTGDTAKRRLKEMRGKIQYLNKWRTPFYVAAYRATVILCSLYRYGRWQVRSLLGRDPNAETPAELQLYGGMLRLGLGRSA